MSKKATKVERYTINAKDLLVVKMVGKGLIDNNISINIKHS